MLSVPTAPVVGGSLVAGYAVARFTRRRPLGALPLAAAGAWCGQRWVHTGGWRRAVPLLGVYLGAFGLSHPLAKRIGAWPSVLVVSGAAAATAHLGADRHA